MAAPQIAKRLARRLDSIMYTLTRQENYHISAMERWPASSYASGLILKYGPCNEESIGFVGDTQWFQALAEPFMRAGVAVAAIGGVYPEEEDLLDDIPPE